MPDLSNPWFKKSVKPSQLRQSSPSLARKTSFSLFRHKKYIIFVLILLGVIGILSQRYLLSDQKSHNPLNSELSDNLQTLEGEREKVDPKFSSTDMGSSSGDVYVGPIRLKGSSYFVDQLDELNAETQANQDSRTQEDSLSVDLQDFFEHPIDTIAQINSSLRASWLNEGRRTTLIKLVDSVSRYYLAYNTFPQSPDPTDTQYGWVEEMRDKRELSGVYQYVLETTYPVAYCGAVNQTGYCYKTDGRNAIIYVKLEKSIGKEMVCDESGVFFLWSSDDNKLGAVCLEGEPMKLSGFNYFKF